MAEEVKSKENEKSCFSIMPISDCDGYPVGHFKHVYDDIIVPACCMAGYTASRADEVKASNLIHLDILKKLIEAPIAICDLSTRNPNVLFELGIRQAFDKPVVLIQEKGTPKIFDISPLRYLEYSKELKYHEVLLFQKELCDAISATVDADGEAGNVNSIVKLLALDSAARIPELKDSREALAIDLMQAEMRELRKIIEGSLIDSKYNIKKQNITSLEYERISVALDKIISNKRMNINEKAMSLEQLMKQAEILSFECRDEDEFRICRTLLDRIKLAMKDIHMF